MRALKTLLRPRQAPPLAPFCLNACRHPLHAHVMQSASDDNPGDSIQDAHSALHGCRHDATSLDGPLMHSAQGLDKRLSAVSRTLKPRVPSRQQNALKHRSQGAVQPISNTHDSAFAPASDSKDKDKHFEALPCQAQQMIGRRKSATALDLLRRKVSLLESEQVSRCDAIILGKSRGFKSASFEHLAAMLKLLKEQLGSGEKACQALAMNPGSLLQPIQDLEQKLKVMADFEITEAVVRKLCTSKYILSVKVESMRESLSFFKDIGLNVDARNKLLWRQPKMLRHSPVFHTHTLNFFESLGMTREKILRLILMRPSLLPLSVDKNLREKCMFFRHQLGFSVNEITRAIYCGVPNLSMRMLQAKIKFFKDEGFSDNDVLLLVSRQPGIFTLSSECVKKKLDFLLREQKYDMADIVKCPVCLLISLQNRMIPRLKVLEENGLCKVFKLATILGATNLNFLKRIGRRVQRAVEVQL